MKCSKCAKPGLASEMKTVERVTGKSRYCDECFPDKEKARGTYGTPRKERIPGGDGPLPL